MKTVCALGWWPAHHLPRDENRWKIRKLSRLKENTKGNRLSLVRCAIRHLPS